MEAKIDPSLLQWESSKVKGFLSKQLIDLQNGGLKLIKVTPSSEYPVHMHPDKSEFIYVLEGMPGITIDEQYYTGKQGDFFIMPASVKHSIYNKGNSECILPVGAIKN